MSVETRTVGERGQVTIPKKLREKENIRGGDSIEFYEENGEIKLKKRNNLEEKLKEAYTENYSRDKDVAEEWEHVSNEANEELD